jgi:hypothetical protein
MLLNPNYTLRLIFTFNLSLARILSSLGGGVTVGDGGGQEQIPFATGGGGLYSDPHRPFVPRFLIRLGRRRGWHGVPGVD